MGYIYLMVSALEGDVIVTPLLRTTMGQHVGEVMVIKIHAPVMGVKVLVVFFAVHDDFQRFTSVLQPANSKNAKNWQKDGTQKASSCPNTVKMDAGHLDIRHCLEAVLGVEKNVRINDRVMNTAHNVRRLKDRAGEFIRKELVIGTQQVVIAPMTRMAVRESVVGHRVNGACMVANSTTRWDHLGRTAQHISVEITKQKIT
eukprot:GEMP01052353.1.p1 GENE.GEMP01052353.1~~GEMP01052353.1.p1  ORF type:complete len:201 (-),score=23.67 GEMP01052353.1:4-606(-)